jgi:RNA polymerase sigma factor (sigma-70 family)
MRTSSPPSSVLNMKQLETHVSRVERAFGTKTKASELGKHQWHQLVADREEFIKLYQPAAMGYIRGVIVRLTGGGDALDDDVHEVWSNLVTRLLEGAITSFEHRGNVGSFRNWLRRVIANECKAHLNARNRIQDPPISSMTEEAIDPSQVDHLDPADDPLVEVLRKTIIAKAYEALQEDGLNGAAVLFVARHQCQCSTAELAAHLSQKSGRPVKVDAAKKRLQRGRELFAQNLVDQIARIERTYSPDRLEEAAIELGLHVYCKRVIAQRRSECGEV